MERKYRAALKNDRGKILDKFFFSNNFDRILELIKRIHNHRTKKCNVVLKSTDSMLMRYTWYIGR